jgi:hypothetical protein
LWLDKLNLKTLRRILIYLLITLSTLLVALVVSALLFQDRIIQEFIREANKQLNTPVKIGKIEVSTFQDFPRISIVLNDVYIEDSHPGLYPLLTATRISFQMNPLEVWAGNYTVKGLKIENSETNLKLNNKGENNYSVVKKSTGKGASTVKFELKDVDLFNTKVHYIDINARQEMTFTSRQMVASVSTENDLYTIVAHGNLVTEKIQIDRTSVLNGKSFEVTSHLLYDDGKKILTINPSTLLLRKASFSVKGDYSWKNKNIINLETKGENADIQTIVSLLPEELAKKLEKYESSGDVYFNSRLKGEISKTRTPSISIDFGFTDATIFHPDYKSRIEEASLEGSFANSDLRNLRNAALVLKNITGKLNNEPFTSNFIIQDFIDPDVICDFKGKMDAPSVLSFYPVESLQNVTGTLDVDLAFEGKIELLKNKATAQRVSTLGTVSMENISLDYGKEKIQLQNLNGDLQFSNNDLALSNVRGKLGNSDFLLNGFFKNIITFLLFEDQPIGIETDLKSNFIDLNQIFAISFGNDEDSSQPYTFSISRNLNLNFNCDIKSLRYKKLHGRNLKGDLLVKNEMAVTRNFSMKAMGGNLELSGIVDAQNNKAIDVVTTAKLTDLYLDSVFYVFENFKQEFIQDKHLKGRASADVSMEMVLDQHLKLFSETLIADISTTIKKGELNNFEPMKKLSRYLDDEGLSKLRFSDLKNDIHIEKKVIYIPQMDIRSNVTDLTVSGTHTFDQRIDYRVVTPLRKKKIKDAEAQLAIEEDPRGGPKLFLKIVGTTDDYKISYDTEAVKRKIVTDFKREVQELKDAFKTKGKQKQKEVELQKDDYFDWDQQQ